MVLVQVLVPCTTTKKKTFQVHPPIALLARVRTALARWTRSNFSAAVPVFSYFPVLRSYRETQHTAKSCSTRYVATVANRSSPVVVLSTVMSTAAVVLSHPSCLTLYQHGLAGQVSGAPQPFRLKPGTPRSFSIPHGCRKKTLRSGFWVDLLVEYCGTCKTTFRMSWLRGCIARSQS